MRGRRLRWLASASLLFHGSLRGTGPQECPIAVPGKAADLPGAGRTVVAHFPIIRLRTGGATIPTVSFYPCAAVMSGVAHNRTHDPPRRIATVLRAAYVSKERGKRQCRLGKCGPFDFCAHSSFWFCARRPCPTIPLNSPFWKAGAAPARRISL